MRAALVIMALAGACGGKAADEEAVAPRARLPGDLPSPVATAAGPDDVVVATVDGRPVWGSCVQAQARRTRGDVKAALRECVDFELLAQAAERRGAAKAPEVAEAIQAALVNRLVETDFEKTYAGPESMAREIDRIYKAAEARERIQRPEFRASLYIRVPLKRDASPDEVERAKAIADAIYADLPGRGYAVPHLKEVFDRHKRTVKNLEIATQPVSTDVALISGYREAVFGLAEIGDVAPPVRDSEGWDIVLLTEIIPAKRFTREDIVNEAWPEMRRKQFARWVDDIARKNRVKATIDPEPLKLLDEGGASDDPTAAPGANVRSGG